MRNSSSRPAALDRRAVVGVGDERRQVRVRQRVAQHDLGVEVGRVPGGAGTEAHDDIGVGLLGADERLGVALAVVELAQDLVGRVAAPRAVALDLPRAPQLLRRSEEHAHVVDRAQRLGVEAEQPLDQEVARRAQVVRRAQRPRAMVVDRLQHRLPAAQVRQVLREDVEVVGVGMQRSDAEVATLLAVMAVVVVSAQECDVAVPEHAHEAAREGRLAGSGVTDHTEHDRTRHWPAKSSRPRANAPPVRARRDRLTSGRGVLRSRSFPGRGRTVSPSSTPRHATIEGGSMPIPTELVGSLPRPMKLQEAYEAYDEGKISLGGPPGRAGRGRRGLDPAPGGDRASRSSPTASSASRASPPTRSPTRWRAPAWPTTWPATASSSRSSTTAITASCRG